MLHQDIGIVQRRLKCVYLKRALDRLLGGMDWGTIRFRADCSWVPQSLVAAAMLWVWSGEATLIERFMATRRLNLHWRGHSKPPAGSYQAFIKILCRWTAELIQALQTHLRIWMFQALPSYVRVEGFLAFGVDGSRIALPRTRSNEQAYSPSPKRSGKKKRGRRKRPSSKGYRKQSKLPQLWLTMLSHLGTGLPWNWRIGPSDSSEREHALQMLSSLPSRAMLVADAGFAGYDFAHEVLQSGRELLIRVGANVRLLKGLGYVRRREDIVYVWPDQAARRKQEPLTFRLVVVQCPRHPIYLITSVQNPKALGNGQVWKLYQKRWGLEVLYRHLKQTFQTRKLRSANAENAAVELNWKIAGLWAMLLVTAVEFDKRGLPLDRISVAGAWRVFRTFMREAFEIADPKRSLAKCLSRAVIDNYQRKNKQSRDYPRKKKHRRPGPPTIIWATPRQRQIAYAIQKG